MAGPHTMKGTAVAREFFVDGEGVAVSDTQETPTNARRILGLGGIGAGIGVAVLAGSGAVLAVPVVATAAATAATGYGFYRAIRWWRSR
jgi:hypothetical protein